MYSPANKTFSSRGNTALCCHDVVLWSFERNYSGYCIPRFASVYRLIWTIWIWEECGPVGSLKNPIGAACWRYAPLYKSDSSLVSFPARLRKLAFVTSVSTRAPQASPLAGHTEFDLCWQAVDGVIQTLYKLMWLALLQVHQSPRSKVCSARKIAVVFRSIYYWNV